MNAGLTFTQQTPMSAIAHTEVGNTTPTELWNGLTSSWEFVEAIITGIRDTAAGKSPVEYYDEINGYDLPTGFDTLAVRVAKGEANAAWELARAVRSVGSGRSTTDDVGAIPQLLAGDYTPTIAVTITEAFFERRADQRRSVCQLLASFAQAFDVRVVGERSTHRELSKRHRGDLPGVSEECNTPRKTQSVAAAVETAQAVLDHDTREVSVLRDLGDEAGETLSKHAIEADAGVSRSRVSQTISALEDHDLVATFDIDGKKHVELLEPGRELLARLDAEIGRQAELDASVSEARKDSKYSRVNTQTGGVGRSGHTDRRKMDDVIDVAYLPRWRDAAVASSATEHGVALVDHPQEPADDLRQPYLSYDTDADRMVVSAEYNNPMQYWVCVARALTDRRVWDDILTPERLDGDAGNLGGLDTNSLRVLRDARCLGWLKDADATGADYADALMDACEELLDLLRRWHHDDYEDASSFRGVIIEHALGLAGTVAHLCDLADVDLIREVRLPEFSRRFDTDRREDLLESLANGLTIQSAHGHFSAYRQLCEQRADKRAAAMEPSIPADDPQGDMIGSFVLVGDGVTALENPLRDKLNTTEVHDDAPEFEVTIPVVTEQSRSDHLTAIKRVCSAKRLRVTPESVSLMQALTGSIYDVTAALWRALRSENEDSDRAGRQIRLDEVRRALGTLPADRILPTMQPTLRKTAKALLTAASPLTKTELADRADVSPRSVATHLPTLETLGLVMSDADDEADTATKGCRYRLKLPFETGEERGDDLMPDIVAGSTFAKPQDAIHDLTLSLFGDLVGSYDTPIGQALISAEVIPNLRSCDIPDELREWIDIAEHLRPDDATGAKDRNGSVSSTLIFGAEIHQAPITVGSMGVADD